MQVYVLQFELSGKDLNMSCSEIQIQLKYEINMNEPKLVLCWSNKGATLDLTQHRNFNKVIGVRY